MISKTYAGIDISKLTFDAAIYQPSGYQYHKFTNDEKGFRALSELLPAGCHVVMEASGPYYLKLAGYLYEQGFALSVVNPLVIRRFCQMRLSRTKTDRKDAMMIAEYGRAEQPAPWKPQERYVLHLRQMQAAVDLLNKSRTAFIRQLEAFDACKEISLEAVSAAAKAKSAVEKQITVLEQKMEQLIEQHHKDMFQRLQTIPRIGKKSALLLIVLSGGFTRFENSRQLSSYIGLCPRIFESGTSVKGKARITKMGMSRIRAVLYVCSWAAKKYNKACSELYGRLVAKGKAKRQALIAVANKLLKQAFAIAVNGMDYQENYMKNTCF